MAADDITGSVNCMVFLTSGPEIVIYFNGYETRYVPKSIVGQLNAGNKRDDDLDRIYSAIDKHIGLAKDEEGAAGVDDMLHAIERAGQIIAFAMKVQQRVRQQINLTNRCPLCNGMAPWGNVRHRRDCPVLEGAE